MEKMTIFPDPTYGARFNSVGYKHVFSDFDCGDKVDPLLFASYSGTGSSVSCDATDRTGDNVIGALLLSPGTTATGYARFLASLGNYMRLGKGYTSFKTRMSFNALSTSAQEFNFKVGYINSTWTHGVCFEYTRTTSVNWLINCKANNVVTTVDTGILVDDLYHTFEVQVNEDGTLASFYIDEQLVGTINTNIPTAYLSAPGYILNKTAGTTNTPAVIDWYDFEAYFPNRT